MATRPKIVTLVSLSRKTQPHERANIDPYDPELQTLTELAGIYMPPAILRSILQLLEVGIAPQAIVRLLHEILMIPKSSEDYNRIGKSVNPYRHIELSSDASTSIQQRVLVQAEQIPEKQILEYVKQEV